MLIDYYALLEVAPDATLAEIKRSYRRLVRKYHPDLNPSFEDSQQIKRINEAYEVLRDLEKRCTYDRRLAEERRRIAQEALLRQRREQARRAAEMSWGAGIIGFMKELKKGLRDP